jgi:hypothetical protein
MESEVRDVKVGQSVTYVDPTRAERAALVTAVHSTHEYPSINVVFVNDDENQRDNYGQKIERSTSVPHQTDQKAPGNFWR